MSIFGCSVYLIPIAECCTNESRYPIRLLYQLTEPILSPIRRFATFGMMDFSPIVALILLEVIRGFLVTLLSGAF